MKTKAERYEELGKRVLGYRIAEKGRVRMKIFEVEEELKRLKSYLQNLADSEEIMALELQVMKKVLGDEPLQERFEAETKTIQSEPK